MKKIFLSGPDVFAPHSKEIGEKHETICERNGFIGIFPLNIEVKKSSNDIKYDIVKADIYAVDESDYIVANLSNFRGTKEHPSCDSGTAWECGYGLAKRKTVLGFTQNIESVPNIMNNLLDLVIIGDFEDAINITKKGVLKNNYQCLENLFEEKIINIDPEYPDIKDISAEAAFILGYRYGKGLQCNAMISDTRSEVEKYGKVDENRFSVDNFNQCANIMIECTCNIIKKEE